MADTNNKELLLWAIDAEDWRTLEVIGDLIKDGRIKFQMDDIDEAFQLLMAKEDEVFAIWFLLHFPKPRENLLAFYFNELSNNWVLPRLLYALQSEISPSLLADSFRKQKQFGKYLVNVSEAVDLKELYASISSSGLPASKTRKAIFAHEMRCSLRIRRALMDAIFSKRCYFVAEMLSNIQNYYPNTRNLQSVVNDSFVEAVKRGYYSIAQLIVTSCRRNAAIAEHLQVNQTGFDMAVSYAISSHDVDSLSWLFNGRLGFLPSEDLITREFRSISLSLARRSRGYELDRNGRLVRIWPLMVHPRTRLQPATLNIDILNAVVSLLKPRVANEVLDASEFEIQGEVKLIELKERKERLRNRVMYQSNMALDIHSFSARQVLDEEGAAVVAGDDVVGAVGDNHDEELNQTPSTTKSLNDRILDFMKSRIDPQISMRSYPNMESITNRMTDLVVEEFSSDSLREDSALRVVASVMNDESLEVFRVTLSFLDSMPENYRQQAISIWLAGFVSESITEHSCRAGILERCVTGLRGVPDEGLSRIFAQAEAPFLVRSFLSGLFNIYCRTNGKARCKALATILNERGLTQESSEEQASQILFQFAKQEIMGYDSNFSKYEEEVTVMVESVIDSYETEIRPFVLPQNP